MAVVLVTFGVGLSACGGGSPQAAWQSPGASGAAGQPAAQSPSASPAPSGKPVHVRLYQKDGTTYGVGMPIIAYLSGSITSAKDFAAATQVTVNGAPAEGSWYFQKSAIYEGYPLEAHYRPAEFWPAHASIHMDLSAKGRSAGPGLVFDNSLTMDVKTGPANIGKVDGKTLRMVVTSDGNQVFDFPVSLGKASTPTFNGTKVVMGKSAVERMVGDGYDEKVPWSVRITNSGEYVHSASWNGGNIGQRSTSHGCTNLTEANAKSYFDFAQVGDPITYTDTGGPTMPTWDGYGDWNVPWTTWQGGGTVPSNK
ncbi:L,D-transpeptidase [Dactylosporangium matsuzakiense]|uniref:L,D-transpeptidase n=1 Tax=Dactylosporangium matsuzakiense TaxID=53360 RepID=UPI0021C45C60|nr:L,D-transpeptidase [Dactylosporangium matsuzakiense]UWZ42608.1 L,D-transpeptidase [Dactylosporangium matsuzakiense]